MDLQSFALDPDLVQQLSGIHHSLSGPQVPFHEVATALQTCGHVDAVRARLEGAQQVEDIYLSTAGKPYDLDVGRILQPRGTGQIRCRVRTVMTAESDDLGLECLVFLNV